jgi:hypothetical protein
VEVYQIFGTRGRIGWKKRENASSTNKKSLNISKEMLRLSDGQGG